MRSGWDWVLGSNSSRPARPHHHFTEDGRRVREVLSYSRRVFVHFSLNARMDAFLQKQKKS